MSASPAKIFDFPSGTEIADTTSRANMFPPGTDLSQHFIDKIVEETASSNRIELEDLYPEMIGVRPELNIASRLLARSLVDLDKAVASSAVGDYILADDAIQRFQAALPELFNCRVLSDSFGALVTAILNALNNQHGTPLSPPQIEALRNAVRTLRSEPFMGFDAAVTEIMKMEETGFIVEPPEFEILADWLDE